MIPDVQWDFWSLNYDNKFKHAYENRKSLVDARMFNIHEIKLENQDTDVVSYSDLIDNNDRWTTKNHDFQTMLWGQDGPSSK